MNAETHFDLWTVPINYDDGELKSGTPEPFLRTKAGETYPAFSPDGRWIAFVSLQSGAYEVYVRSFPDTGVEIKVSQGGGRLPVWAKNRPELIYETADYRLMSIHWRVHEGRFEADSPQPWSDTVLGDTGVLGNFDVAPDGSIVALLSASAPQQPSNHVSFRLHFFEELEARLSAAAK